MPPRRRTTADADVDTQDLSYDGVPTVQVVVGAEPDPEPDPPVELPVVEVPAIDAADTQPDHGEGQQP